MAPGVLLAGRSSAGLLSCCVQHWGEHLILWLLAACFLSLMVITSNLDPPNMHCRFLVSFTLGLPLQCSCFSWLVHTGRHFIAIGMTLTLLQKNFWHEFTEGLGLDCLLPARLRSKGPGDTIAVSAPSQRPQSTARAFSERLAVRDELQKPLHVFTDVRRGSFASG